MNHSRCYLGQDLTAYIRNGREVAQMCQLKEPFSWWWQKSGKMPNKNLRGIFIPLFQNKNMGKTQTCIYQPRIYENSSFVCLFVCLFVSGRNTDFIRKGNPNTALPRASSINQVFPLALEYSVSVSLFLSLLYLVQEPKAMFNMFGFYIDNIKVNI